MRASTFLAVAASTLAAAAPAADAIPKSHKFNVTNFIFGCTVGCDWYFDVSVEGKGANHPSVKTPVHCEGNLDDDKDYVECGDVSETQSIYAYIVKATNELKLQYEVQKPAEGATYRYYGNRTVYAATSNDADKQKPNFKVKETLATGVA